MISIATSPPCAPLPGLISSSAGSMFKPQLTLPGKTAARQCYANKKLPQVAPGLFKVLWLRGRTSLGQPIVGKCIRDASNAGARLARLAAEQKIRCQNGHSKCQTVHKVRWALPIILSRTCDSGLMRYAMCAVSLRSGSDRKGGWGGHLPGRVVSRPRSCPPCGGDGPLPKETQARA